VDIALYKIMCEAYILMWVLFQHEKIQFAEEVSGYDKQAGFNDMNLSRPLLKVNISIPSSFYQAISTQKQIHNCIIFY